VQLPEPAPWSIVITRRGRGGLVQYFEGSNLITYEVELGGGSTLLIVRGPVPQDWGSEVPWAVDHRKEVSLRVAVAIQWQELPHAFFRLTDGDASIVFEAAPARNVVEAERRAIAAALDLPNAVRNDKVSATEVAETSGYVAHRGVVTPAVVRDFIRQRRDLIAAWARWSKDKRVTKGWYLTPATFRHEVGYLARGSKQNVRRFLDPAKACAHFAIRELDHLTAIGV
jgi:hypothetical protein